MKIKSLSLLLLLHVFCSGFLTAQTKETRNVGEFKALSASAGLEVYMKKGSTSSVVVESSEKNLPKIKTSVVDGTLILGMQGVSISFGSKSRTKIYVTYTSLNAVSASGAAEIICQGVLSADALSISASGGSEIEMEIKVKSLNLQLSGGADVELKGIAANVDISSSGGSDLEAFGLVAQNVNINTSGGADTKITAEHSLHANASGASDILYRGNANDVNVNRSGGADIKKVK